MYLTLISLTYHYVFPSYTTILLKIQVQPLLKICQQAQYALYESYLMQGSLPEDLDLTFLEHKQLDDIQWDGSSLQIAWRQSEDRVYQIELAATEKKMSLQWNCDFNGEASLKEYICHAIAQ